jgi:bacterioferritin-associated ferredoxin
LDFSFGSRDGITTGDTPRFDCDHSPFNRREPDDSVGSAVRCGSLPPVIVCVCNALSETRCRETARRAECRTVGCVYRLQGARIRCGRCLPYVHALLEEVRAAATAAAGAEPPVSAAPSG